MTEEVRRVVVVGAGHAGFQLAAALRQNKFGGAPLPRKNENFHTDWSRQISLDATTGCEVSKRRIESMPSLSGKLISFNHRHVIAGAVFIAVWFIMDLVQFIDWAVQYLRPAASACK